MYFRPAVVDDSEELEVYNPPKNTMIIFIGSQFCHFNLETKRFDFGEIYDTNVNYAAEGFPVARGAPLTV